MYIDTVVLSCQGLNACLCMCVSRCVFVCTIKCRLVYIFIVQLILLYNYWVCQSCTSSCQAIKQQIVLYNIGYIIVHACLQIKIIIIDLCQAIKQHKMSVHIGLTGDIKQQHSIHNYIITYNNIQYTNSMEMTNVYMPDQY